MNITPEQVRAARAILRLEQSDLAQRTGLSVVTIRRVEAVGGEHVAPSTITSIHAALEQAGAEFIPDGVRKRPVVAREAQTLYDDLRAISIAGAARLRDRDLTDADLYDEDGLPA